MHPAFENPSEMNRLTEEGYTCTEYSDAYFVSGRFHPTEAQILLPFSAITLDEERQFLRIGGAYDDHDMYWGYRKGEVGIWGHYNQHWDGRFFQVSPSLHALCDGWYPGTKSDWGLMHSVQQWQAISGFFNSQTQRYQWDFNEISAFINHCLNTGQLTDYFIKTYEKSIGITLKNPFLGRSFTHMVRIQYELSQSGIIVSFQTHFFDYSPTLKTYAPDDFTQLISDVEAWMEQAESDKAGFGKR